MPFKNYIKKDEKFKPNFLDINYFRNLPNNANVYDKAISDAIKSIKDPNLQEAYAYAAQYHLFKATTGQNWDSNKFRNDIIRGYQKITGNHYVNPLEKTIWEDPETGKELKDYKGIVEKIGGEEIDFESGENHFVNNMAEAVNLLKENKNEKVPLTITIGNLDLDDDGEIIENQEYPKEYRDAIKKEDQNATTEFTVPQIYKHLNNVNVEPMTFLTKHGLKQYNNIGWAIPYNDTGHCSVIAEALKLKHDNEKGSLQNIPGNYIDSYDMKDYIKWAMRNNVFNTFKYGVAKGVVKKAETGLNGIDKMPELLKGQKIITSDNLNNTNLANIQNIFPDEFIKLTGPKHAMGISDGHLFNSLHIKPDTVYLPEKINDQQIAQIEYLTGHNIFNPVGNLKKVFHKSSDHPDVLKQYLHEYLLTKQLTQVPTVDKLGFGKLTGKNFVNGKNVKTVDNPNYDVDLDYDEDDEEIDEDEK